MSEELQSLKTFIKLYRVVDDEIRSINKLLYEKREHRKILELDIADIIKQPEFSSYNKLRIEEDDSTIKIQRPETYQKPWNLSKKDLEKILKSYFGITPSPDAESCFKYICDIRKSELVGTEFVFSRTLPEEDS